MNDNEIKTAPNDQLPMYRYDDYKYEERLVIYYTQECQIRCAHCASHSSPDTKAKMTVEEASSYLVSAAECGFRWVCLTGGEMTLHWDEFIKLLELGNSLKLVMAVESNVGWAVSREIALSRLKEAQDAGLKFIIPSADAYHLPFVPLEYICNIAWACTELGLGYNVFFAYSGNAKKDQLILETLEQRKVIHEIGELEYWGRARNLSASFFKSVNILETGDCMELGPLICINGDVIGCCSPEVDKNNPFHFGNAREEPLSVILKRFLKSPYPAMVRSRGFQWIYRQLLKNAGYRKIFENKTYYSICDFCFEFFDNPELSRYILDAWNAETHNNSLC